MVWLHGGNHSQLFVPLEILGCNHLVMLDAVADVDFRRLRPAELKGFERHPCAAISNGMKANLKIVFHPLSGLLVQSILLVTGNAGVLWIVCVWGEHGGGARPQGAIHESLEHAGAQHGIICRMM